MTDRPPPYMPLPPGASAPDGPPAFSSQPPTFTGSPYQSFPQTFAGGGDASYYHTAPDAPGPGGPGGPPGPLGPPGPYLPQPGYQGYYGGPPQPAYPYGEQQKHTVFLMDQDRGGGHAPGGVGHAPGGGGHAPSGAAGSCLAACSAALCCCCLWDLLTSHLH